MNQKLIDEKFLKYVVQQNYMLDGRKVVKCEDFRQWIDWEKKCEMAVRRVARTEKDGVCVSTVFTGFDHCTDFRFPGLEEHGLVFLPKVFETVIIEDGFIEHSWHYCTWEEAEEGHREACEFAGV